MGVGGRRGCAGAGAAAAGGCGCSLGDAGRAGPGPAGGPAAGAGARAAPAPLPGGEGARGQHRGCAPARGLLPCTTRPAAVLQCYMLTLHFSGLLAGTLPAVLG